MKIYKRLYLKSLLLSISFLVLFFILPSQAQTEIDIVEFTESTEYIINPGIGWQHFPGIGSQLLPETVEYPPRENISWKVLNPAENVYDWTNLDNYINQAKSRGNQIGFRIYTMRGESYGGHQVPQWVINKGAKIINGAPDYNNCVYQEEFGKFIEKVRQRYDGNPDIAFIDISGYGNFNEWSWQNGVTQFDNKWASDYSKNIATRDSFSTLDGKTRRRLADIFIGGSYNGHECRNSNNKILRVNYSYPGFSKTQLLMPYAGIRQSTQYVFTMRKDVGFRFDCLGSATKDNIQQRVANEVLQIWKKAPVVFEFCANLDSNLYLNADKTLKFTHGSLVHDNIKSNLRNQQEVTKIMKNAGYRYYLKKASYSKITNSTNPRFSLDMSWVNTGYAPSYKKMGQDFELRVLLENKSNSSIKYEYVLNEDVSKWMPAETIGVVPAPINNVSFSVDTNNYPSGVYKVYVGIKDKRTNKYINLSTNGEFKDRMLFIGEYNRTIDSNVFIPNNSSSISLSVFETSQNSVITSGTPKPTVEMPSIIPKLTIYPTVNLPGGSIPTEKFGWDYNLTKRCVKSPQKNNSENYYQDLLQCDIDGKNWTIAIQSEKELGKSCPGPLNQSFMVNSPDSPITLNWLKHVDEYGNNNWSVNLKTDLVSKSHPCGNGYFTWVAFMDHVSHGGGPFPKPSEIVFSLTANANDYLPNGASRVILGWSGYWDGKARMIEMTIYGNNWGDNYPDNPKITNYINNQEYQFVHIEGKPYNINLPKNKDQKLFVPWYEIIQDIVSMGFLDKPTNWNNTSTMSISVGHELNNFAQKNSGVIDLWFTNFRIEKLNNTQWLTNNNNRKIINFNSTNSINNNQNFYAKPATKDLVERGPVLIQDLSVNSLEDMNELLTLKGVVFEDKDGDNLLSEEDLVVNIPIKINILDSKNNILVTTSNSIDGWEVQVPREEVFFIEFVSENKTLDTLELTTTDDVNEYIVNFQIGSGLDKRLTNQFNSVDVANVVFVLIVVFSILIGGVVFYKLVLKNNYKSI